MRGREGPEKAGARPAEGNEGEREALIDQNVRGGKFPMRESGQDFSYLYFQMVRIQLPGNSPGGGVIQDFTKTIN